MNRACAVAIALSGGCLDVPERPPCTQARALDEVNSTDDERAPWLSPDYLELFFASNRLGGPGDFELMRATRTSIDEPFSFPEFLSGTGINTSAFEADPFLTADGLTMYFASQRSGNFSKPYVAHRASRDTERFDDFHVLAEIGDGDHPSLTEDGTTLYFSAPGTSFTQLYRATRAPGAELFDTPQMIPELTSGTHFEANPSISADGQTLLFATNRSGQTRIVRSMVRGTTFTASEPVDEVLPIEPRPDPSDADNDPALNANGRTIVFASDRTEGARGYDIMISCE